jgi:hypothetical protein|tara:strand:+ start:802 stop:1029 length:228 start_codon:yes stop_codon:yes gene_type:complete
MVVMTPAISMSPCTERKPPESIDAHQIVDTTVREKESVCTLMRQNKHPNLEYPDDGNRTKNRNPMAYDDHNPDNR